MATGLLLIALAAVAWSTTGAALKFIGPASVAAPFIAGAAKLAVGAPLLAGAARVFEGPIRSRGGRGFFVAGLFMAAYQVCYFFAVPLAGVAATALLAICSAPILVAVLARILLGERFTPGRVLALALGVSGAVLLVAGGDTRLGPDFTAGALLALSAGLSYSLYAVVTKGTLAGTPPLTLSALTCAVGALVLAPIFAVRPADTTATLARSWPLLLYLGAVTAALPYSLYTSGLRRVPASTATVAGLLEPLIATVLGVVLFGERLGAAGAVGGSLLLLAVALLAFLPNERTAGTLVPSGNVNTR